MQTVVGVLRGGPSREHEVSLRSGAAILTNLPEERYTARDIYIDKNGQWHLYGRPSTADKILRQIDVALLPLHGEYGESGEVQHLLERFGVPYVGTDAYGSQMARNKVVAKAKALEAGILTPDFKYIERVADAETGVQEAIRRFHQPMVIKPVGWGSSIGISIVGGYAPVLSAVQKLFNEGAESVLVEEYIRGREASAGVIDGLRGEKLYALPTVEIVPPPGDFFSYESKYSGVSGHMTPGRFSRVENEELQRIAKVMHRALDQRHYSRSDFIVAPKGIYFLETNSAAGVGLDEHSLLVKSLTAVGVSIRDFLSHLVNLALSR